MTAGDLIRQALADGETKLGLAKKITGCKSGTDREVLRWRDIINRASRGSEPQLEQANRIAAFFGASGLETPRRGPARDRLRSLEGEVADLTIALDAARKNYARLQRRVAALERLVPLQAEPATRRGRSGR